MDLQICWFDPIRVDNISRQLIHSFCYFRSHDAPSHRIKHVNEFCKRLQEIDGGITRVGYHFSYLGCLDGRRDGGSQGTQNTETMRLPGRRRGFASYVRRREVTERSLRKQQALRTTFNRREKPNYQKITCIPPKGLSPLRTCRAMYSCEASVNIS